MYRCAHGMIKALELRVLELTPQFYSDALPQYLEQTIQDAQCVLNRFSSSSNSARKIYFFSLYPR